MTLLVTVNWSHVWLVTLLGFAMVITLLLVLICLLKLFGWIMKPRAKVEKPHHVADTVAAHKPGDEHVTLTANATAAIAMALHLYYNGIHDEEPTKVTIKRVERKYSPWNSKLYGMNNLHR